MTTVHVYKDSDGRLRGVTAEDERNRRRWIQYIDSMAPGDHAEYETHVPRDPAQHGKFMRMVTLLLERTEAFDDFNALRKWITVGANYIEQDASGKWVAKSLAYDKMDGSEFAEFFRKAEDFLWTDRARAMLWRHMDMHQHTEAIRQLLEARS
jgi:hypothetical protein